MKTNYLVEDVTTNRQKITYDIFIFYHEIFSQFYTKLFTIVKLQKCSVQFTYSKKIIKTGHFTKHSLD